VSAVEFVNRHGGWNGTHLLAPGSVRQDGEVVRFQQYFQGLPVLPGRSGMRFGYMQLTMQQGEVAQYERPLIVMETEAEKPAEEAAPPGADVPGEDGANGPAEDGAVSGGGKGESGASVSAEDGAKSAVAGNGGHASGGTGNGGHASGATGNGGTTGGSGGSLNGGNLNDGDANGESDGAGADGQVVAERGLSRELPAGETLERLIRQKADGAPVEALLPVYRAVVREDRIWLTPVWAIRLADGEWRVLD
jgi:hypothetical protein